MSQPLRDLMVARGLTAAEVARRAHLSKSAMSQILRGHHGVRWSTALRIASVLGVRPDEIAFPMASIRREPVAPQSGDVAEQPEHVA